MLALAPSAHLWLSGGGGTENSLNIRKVDAFQPNIWHKDE
jgi:hypothetical protein